MYLFTGIGTNLRGPCPPPTLPCLPSAHLPDRLVYSDVILLLTLGEEHALAESKSEIGKVVQATFWERPH